MRRVCEDCGRRYEDIHASTLCPHKGIGYCAVCDCVVCVCTKETAGDWERSSGNREGKTSWKEIFNELEIPDPEKEFREAMEKEKAKIIRERLWPAPKRTQTVH